MEIKVLGSSCGSCHKLYEETQKAVEKMGQDIEIEYITDPSIMISYSIMSAPALMVNGKILSQGRTLKAKEIEQILNGLDIESSSDSEAACSCSCDCDSSC